MNTTLSTDDMLKVMYCQLAMQPDMSMAVMSWQAIRANHVMDKFLALYESIPAPFAVPIKRCSRVSGIIEFDTGGRIRFLGASTRLRGITTSFIFVDDAGTNEWFENILYCYAHTVSALDSTSNIPPRGRIRMFKNDHVSIT